MREHYIIVRLDYAVVPAGLAYVGHGDTPHDLNLRFTYFSTSATAYSNKRHAIQEAKRLHRIFNGYRFKVNGEQTRRTVFDIL